MKTLKHVVRLTVLLALCILMVACPEPASDLGGGGNEFDIFLGFPQAMGAASRTGSTINDDVSVKKVYVKVYNSSGVHLPAIDATSDIADVTKLTNKGSFWSATVILAAPASGTIGFEVWAVDESEYHVYEGGTTHTVGQNGNILTIPTHAVSTTYALRSTGPAGGLVFYDKGNYVGGWRYLEAAPADIMLGTDDYAHIFGYYRPEGTNITVGTGTAVGTGAANTAKLVNSESGMGEEAYTTSTGTTTTPYYAAKLCDLHTAGGLDDWFLPSKDELALLYNNLKAQSAGGFSDDGYWSSSEYTDNAAWAQYFYGGYQGDLYRGYGENRVRPVRAF